MRVAEKIDRGGAVMYLKSSSCQEKALNPTGAVFSGGKPFGRKRLEPFPNGIQTGGSSPNHGRRIHQETPKKKRTLPAFTPWKVILASFLTGVCGILYIGHVFSTQQALQ
jgi:hypothetical protein